MSVFIFQKNPSKKLIESAKRDGHDDVVKLLLADKRVDPSAYDNLAIRKSSAYGQYEVVKLLLEDPRVDLAIIDIKNMIAKAESNGYYRVVQVLLQHSESKKVFDF